MFGEASPLDLSARATQDLVKKMEQANWGETHTMLEKYPEEISQRCKVGFVSIYISSNLLAKT